MELIDGKKVSEDVRERVRQVVGSMPRKPKLVAVLVGEDPASQVYVRNKEKACVEAGMLGEVIRMSATTSESELFGLIDKLNADDTVDGILIQLPLPGHLPEPRLMEALDPNKDADGFHIVNAGKFYLGHHPIQPCTPAGVMELLKAYKIDTTGKRAVVLGRSNIVGKPMAKLLMDANATVTIAHSRTKDLAGVCREADILVAAIGKPEFVTAEMVKDGAVVIDVGINRKESETGGKAKLVGDVDFEAVKAKCSYITPVPGGCGPMTIAMLLVNTVKLSRIRQGLTPDF